MKVKDNRISQENSEIIQVLNFKRMKEIKVDSNTGAVEINIKESKAAKPQCTSTY